MTEPKRKLAAIVFTDIASFTQLSARDEPTALNLLNTQRNTYKVLKFIEQIPLL